MGEPCTHGWYGVMCCPYNFPRLVLGGTSGPRCAQDLSSPIDIQLPNRSLPNFGAVSKATAASFGGKGQRSLIEVGRENEAIPSSVMTVPVVGDNDRSLCATGIITGTYLDYATCAVVGLALANNNLSGTLSSNALPQSFPIRQTAESEEFVICSFSTSVEIDSPVRCQPGLLILSSPTWHLEVAISLITQPLKWQ